MFVSQPDIFLIFDSLISAHKIFYLSSSLAIRLSFSQAAHNHNIAFTGNGYSL